MLSLIRKFIRSEDGFLQFLAPIAGALIAGSSAKSAAKTQARATDRAADVQQNMFDTTSAYFAPYRRAGENALRTYVDQVGTDFTKAPGYEFGLNEGLRAIEGSAAARGNLMSGATLQALQGYGQDYATRAYDNWLNRVGGIMSTGQASAGQQAALGQNFANNQADLITQGANAMAAGKIGFGNAINSGINNALGAYQYQKSMGI